MSPSKDPPQPRQRMSLTLLSLTALFAALFAFAVSALLVNIFERKQEAKNPFFRVVELNDNTVDPQIWGKNFPLQYDLYRRTVDMARTRFGGSEALPHRPEQIDPRTSLPVSRIDADPRLKRMWAGYAFARDFREERGHAYMLDDQTYTERVRIVKQPGSCINCHASAYTAYKKLGNGDIKTGFSRLNSMPYEEARQLVTHPISCIDCHDPETMQLRITRPAFIEGIRLLKAAEGVADFDVNSMATRQEMRSYVCGQCHVEYYFKGSDKQLTFPWQKGRRADDILAFYDETGFRDWVHEETGAPMLKAQHPEFELWSEGIHARSGVACADCHMPYKRIGALKISDHHVRSPLLNVAQSCQTCHRAPEADLRARAEKIQERTQFSRDLALDALVDLIDSIKRRSPGLPQDQLDSARNFQRKASFLVDFVEAENSSGFHASQESMRLLVVALDYIRKGELSLSAPASQPPQKPTSTTE